MKSKQKRSQGDTQGLWEGESKLRKFLGWLVGGGRMFLVPITPIFIITFVILLGATIAYPTPTLLLPGMGFIYAFYYVGFHPGMGGSGIPMMAIVAGGIINGVIYGVIAWLVLFLGLLFTYKGD